LQGLLGLVFDRETGRKINDDKAVNSPVRVHLVIDSIRQFCLAFKKVELQCDPFRVRKALESFIEVEHSFETFNPTPDDTLFFQRVSGVLWGNSVGALRLDTAIPRHGPGATAEGISGNRKFRWQYWYERLEPYLPLVSNGFPISSGELSNDRSELENVSFIPSDQELPVKVTPVPKTLKGPRIIAIEPCCMQYAQQGIRRIIYDMIESHWITAGRINFRDQSVNQSLALMSSETGRLATIDLSDASDRVPLSLVSLMFESNPDFWDAILACRSTSAKLPTGEIISPLRKFASMGSALCFPIEAMYFYTVCVVALLKTRGLPVSFRSIRQVFRNLCVWG
jgi:hypothetical protein